ncbi:MAG: TetR/AcrR family transcriptional regulator C-terminal domain-containing protein [Actinobacteria bacterium]|nr:TetR/AcrR family transcriptional regulator C-terminal domain-containing protein [Actinomycetota bacterium]
MTTTRAPETQERKEPLTRERILHRALAMIDRDGVEGLSMRRLAAELDAAPMSLYNHVPNKEALLEGLTEVLLSQIDVSALDLDDWVEAMRTGMRSFRDVLLAHPNAVPLIETKTVITPAAVRPLEASLTVLSRAGFPPQAALSAHWTFVGFTFGHVTSQIVNPMCRSGGPETDEALSQAGLTADEFPNFLASLPYAASYDAEEAFDFGLDAILQGLKAKLEASDL